jgi:hypothetical protein
LTTTKEEDFKQRLAAVLADLRQDGVEDGKAMFILGAAATRMCDLLKQPTWSALKPALSKSEQNRLLAQLGRDGDQMLAEGKGKHAYAVQALAVSLVAHSQSDPIVREGEKLLDAIIDQTIANFRKHAQPHLRKTN